MKKQIKSESNSWLKLYRKFLDWEWYDDINVCRLFIHFLLKANYKDKKWRGETIKRGSFITSLGNLSKETGLSVRQVRVALNKLILTKEVTKQSTSSYTRITITSYEEYQANDKPNDKRVTNQRQTNDKPMTTTIESIERKEGIEYMYTSFIKQFNSIVGTSYRGDSKSKKSFSARIKDYSIKEIIKAVENASKDKYLMGDNPNGKKYLTPEYILRENKLEEWLNSAKSSPKYVYK
jgi:uncharacterized phage protein (TIGR02220 family)